MKKQVDQSKTHIVHEMLVCFVLKAEKFEADSQKISINDKLISDFPPDSIDPCFSASSWRASADASAGYVN